MSDEQTMGMSSQVASTPSGNASGFVASTEQKPVEQPKLIPQEEVNEIVRTVKDKSYSKGYDTARQEFEQRYNQQYAPANQVNLSQPQAHIPFDEAKVDSLINDRLQKIEAQRQQEAQQRAYQQEVEKNMQALAAKINDAKSRYADFDEATKYLDANKLLPHLMLINSVDNAGDILYHIGQDPGKLNKLFPNGITEAGALNEIKKLSDSIKMNQQGQQFRQAPPPLDHLTPSNVGIGNNPNGDDLEVLKRRWTA